MLVSTSRKTHHDALKDEPMDANERTAANTERRGKDRLRIVAAGVVTLAAVGSLIAAFGTGTETGSASDPTSIERAADRHHPDDATTDDGSTTTTGKPSDGK